jgi:hypothetical protein
MGVVPMGLWIARLSLAARGNGRRQEAGWAVAGGMAAGRCSLFSGSRLAGSGRRSLGVLEALLESWEWAEPSGPSKRAGAVGVLRSLPLARTHHQTPTTADHHNYGVPLQLMPLSREKPSAKRGYANGLSTMTVHLVHHSLSIIATCSSGEASGSAQHTSHYCVFQPKGARLCEATAAPNLKWVGKVQQSDALTPAAVYRSSTADAPG